MKRRSRVDLYTRSFAFIGLGLLAVCAALVDGLPAAVALPRVSSPFVVPRQASVQTAIELPGFASTASGMEIEPAVRRVPRPAPAAGPRDVILAASARPKPIDDEDFNSIVLPGALAIPMILESVAALGAPTVELSALLTVVDSWQPPAAPATALADRSNDGFVASALRKTGSTVSTSIGKAGNSMVSAARIVGGAVRRVF